MFILQAMRTAAKNARPKNFKIKTGAGLILYHNLNGRKLPKNVAPEELFRLTKSALCAASSPLPGHKLLKYYLSAMVIRLCALLLSRGLEKILRSGLIPASRAREQRFYMVGVLSPSLPCIPVAYSPRISLFVLAAGENETHTPALTYFAK